MIQLKYAQLKNKDRHFYMDSCGGQPPSFSGEWELPVNYLFTAYRAIYAYRCLKYIGFWICRVGKDLEENKLVFHNPHTRVLECFVEGKFETICFGAGKTYAPRLIDWWKKGEPTSEYAHLCAKYLKPRIKEIPSFELEKLHLPQPQLGDAVLGGDAAFQKWLSTAAVLGGKDADG